jgi:hypothetical protein
MNCLFNIQYLFMPILYNQVIIRLTFKSILLMRSDANVINMEISPCRQYLRRTWVMFPLKERTIITIFIIKNLDQSILPE